MSRLSAEAILISSLLNNHDVASVRNFGVSPEHFVGYREHYNWLLNYLEIYKEEPSWDLFRASFPDFRVSEHMDTRSAVDEMYKTVNKRRLTEAMSEAVDQMGVGDVRAAFKTMAMQPLSTAPKPKSLLTDLSFLDSWDKEHTFIEVPYPTLQRATGGIRPGNLWYLAARPANGKSAHLCNIATKAVLDGNKVVFYSLEMSEAEVRSRFHAKLAQQMGYKEITLTGLRDRRVDRDLYKEFVDELTIKLEGCGGRLDIFTPADGMTTPAVIGARAADYNLNIIDYIGLMKDDRGSAAVSDWRIAAGISNEMKLMAGGCASAFLLASQINREGDSGDRPPKVSQLAQSDALGQDGDVILTFRKQEHDVATRFLIDKNRHGPGDIQFYTQFDPNRGLFPEITEERVDDLVAEYEETH